MNQQDILKLAGELVLAGTTDNAEEIARISEELSRIVWSPDSKKEIATENGATSLSGEFTGFLKFTDKEISKMPKSFRRTFIAEGKVIFYRKRKRGKLYAAATYEARYRRHGFNISVSAGTLEELKARFITLGSEILSVFTTRRIEVRLLKFAARLHCLTQRLPVGYKYLSPAYSTPHTFFVAHHYCPPNTPINPYGIPQ